MKTPKEKAKEMVNEIHKVLVINDYLHSHKASIRLALISIDEICEAINWHEFETPNKEFDYWNKVKLEIEKLNK